MSDHNAFCLDIKEIWLDTFFQKTHSIAHLILVIYKLTQVIYTYIEIVISQGFIMIADVYTWSW